MATTAAEVTVSTAAATAAATRSHMFKIEGYKRIKAMYGTGKCVESCRFEAAGRTWRIRFFPDGDHRENAGHVSLFLKLDDDGGDVDNGNKVDDDKVLVEFKFTLVCPRGGGGGRPADDQPQSGTLTTTFGKKAHKALGLGYSQFMKRKDLEKSRFLRDDCLAIRCDMAVLDHPVDVKEEAAQAHDLERLGVACDCKDDACKSYHLRNASVAFKLRKALLKLFLGCLHV